MKQCIYLIILYTTLHISSCTESKKTYAASNNLNNTSNNQANITTHIESNTIIPSEGGGDIKVKLPEASHNSKEHGREHMIITTIKPTTTTKEKSTTSTMDQNNSSKTSTNTTITASNISVTTAAPEVHQTSIEVNGDSKIKARKGVILPDISTTQPNKMNETTNTTSTTKNISSTPSTTTFLPKKPTVTYSEDEPEPPKVVPPKVFIGDKIISPENYSTTTHTKSRQYLGDASYKKGHDYVLPIVLTILAVPLLAIVLTVVYKRGAEWWQHRHYRRMDFLIDGMYNN